MLDRFFHMNDFEVSKEYEFAVSKPIFRGGDYDRRLIIILDAINSKERIFSDVELSIISSIVKLRKAKNYVEFSNIYLTLRELLFQSFDRENNLDTIKSLLVGNSEISSSFEMDGVNYGSPGIKNVRNNICLSPSYDDLSKSDEGLSSSFKAEVIFGWHSDFETISFVPPSNFMSGGKNIPL